MSLQQDTELEKHLLSRCYDSQSKIVELLQDRYSVTGSQKSTILFKNIVTDTKTKVITTPRKHPTNQDNPRKEENHKTGIERIYIWHSQ